MNKIIYERKNPRLIDVKSDPLEMGVLASFLDESGLIEAVKSEIEEDIKNMAVPGFTFNSVGLHIKDKDTLIIYDLFSEEEYPEEHGFEAPKEALWKLLEEYDKVERTDWKKIEITFDGKEFDMQVEY